MTAAIRGHASDVREPAPATCVLNCFLDYPPLALAASRTAERGQVLPFAAKGKT
jgi:hypothetical protein